MPQFLMVLVFFDRLCGCSHNPDLYDMKDNEDRIVCHKYKHFFIGDKDFPNGSETIV